MSDREFPNNFPDHDVHGVVDGDSHKIDEKFRQKLTAEVERQLEALYAGLEFELDWGDYSVYTGTTGIALLHLHLYQVLDAKQDDRYLKKALYYIEKPLRHLKRKRATFLCGDAGPLAVGAVLYHLLGKDSDSKECLKRLFSRGEELSRDDSLPDEFLFGRVGFLFALLFVRRHLGEEAVSSTLIDQVYKAVVDSGQTLSKKEGSPCPLMYQWHDKKYLGAAHGLAGILYTLTVVGDPSKKKYLDDLVKPSIEYLMTLKFPSGNYPSSIGSETGDKLVHWCHGAPGWLYMFSAAYKSFGDEKYLDAAKDCGQVLWSRGILRKGYGLCHGTAGNGYGFLALYNLTGDPIHLYRACKFAEWCFDYGKHGCRTADRPFSLFEGLAGTIYFMADLLDPEKARFPAFEL